MERKKLYFVDDDESERRSCGDVLAELFKDADIEIVPIAPLPPLLAYSEVVALRDTAGFILDQRLGNAGAVAYSGIDLAEFLRSINPIIPIVLLTNFATDNFGHKNWAVECIAQKKEILSDPRSPEALTFKARLLRHIDVFHQISSDRTTRYHDLLLKSLKGALSVEETSEMQLLDGTRIAPVAGADNLKRLQLDSKIEHLKRLLGDTLA